MRLADLSRLAAQLDGVAEGRRNGLLDWRYRGRLVARHLDDSHVVIRAPFDFRDFLLQSFPETFSVPRRFAKHMMVVADLENGNPDVIEDAVIAAWELQSGKCRRAGGGSLAPESRRDAARRHRTPRSVRGRRDDLRAVSDTDG
jgi:hypothetical protein